jgi:hypothetical protein
MTDDTPPSAGPPPRLSIVSTRRTLWIAGAGGALLLVLGVWLVVANLPRLLRTPGALPAASGEAPAAESRKIHATLFSVAPDGALLMPRSREVLYGATPTEQIRRLVEAEVQAPTDGSVSAIPAGTTVRAIFLGRHGEAFLDLGGTIASGHTGGSLDEALAVYALVNVVTVNIPDVTAVQILIDGHQVDTLSGHVDLRYPLSKGLDWITKGP